MPGISKQDIVDAHDRIKPYIHNTPIFTSQSLNHIAGCELFFKCENFQKIGAFKIRGGMNAALSLSATDLKKGLCTHSSGNHAQAIALAARTLGTKAYIVMPENSPSVKVNAVREYGAEITFCINTQEERERALNKIAEATGAHFIHPFDNDHVITGQATCAKEFIEENDSLDIVMAPVGGGGLLAGTSLATHYFLPAAIVIAGEPEGAADAVLSFQSGKVERAPYVKTIADGLQTTLSIRTLGIIKEHVKNILVVGEEDIKSALKLVYERTKMIIEPSSAVPIAAVLAHKEYFSGQKVGIIITGGNVDLKRVSEWF
ncbi:MAG: pyridoxal-phosphate dependent enzyme [Saprospiraceae bacterium]